MSYFLHRLMGASKAPVRKSRPQPYREPTRGEERAAESEWRNAPR